MCIRDRQVTEQQCAALGGVYRGNGTSCNTAGICATTTPSAACSVTTAAGAVTCHQVSETQCVGMGGVYRGNGTNCSTAGICSNTPTGACCIQATGAIVCLV